ncbi:nucleotidyltransferase family protein [Botryobacter ruber]|uniref:nucleotidyltransferase family protein n=1 Tax=Botryobacter ruber TaxID=2171629 RepID=UPI000E0B0009|nr:nucleotidyltransferase family protein [Botryobacter ruber]
MATGLVLLAAGASTRLGKPKQNLQYKDESLLQRAVREAIASVCEPVVVVVGAHAEAVMPQIAAEPVSIVQNPVWKEGMASSVRAGLKALLAIEPNAAACVFMVCDQPFTDAVLLNALVEVKQTTAKGIVASAYDATLGTPVLFDSTYFPELLALQGQEGAKKLLLRHGQEVASINFPLGGVDIDSASDYEALLQS